MSSACNTCSISAVHKQKICRPCECHLFEVEKRFYWHGLDATFKFIENTKISNEFKVGLEEKELKTLEELDEYFGHYEEEE